MFVAYIFNHKHGLEELTAEEYEAAGMVDDDIETLLLNNLKCSIIKSSPTNIKVTYISDIPYIERLL